MMLVNCWYKREWVTIPVVYYLTMIPVFVVGRDEEESCGPQSRVTLTVTLMVFECLNR